MPKIPSVVNPFLLLDLLLNISLLFKAKTLLKSLQSNDAENVRKIPVVRKIAVDSEENLKINQPSPTLNDGHIVFGLDGHLIYISVGDGGTDDGSTSSMFNQSSVLDKLLWLLLNCWIRAVMNPSIELPYTIPLDNPFVYDSKALGEIYAMDFRKVDNIEDERTRKSNCGRIICTDVGSRPRNADEEWLFEKGMTYSWADMITPHCKTTNCGTLARPGDRPKQIYVYHSHNPQYALNFGDPDFKGKILFADFVSGNIFALRESFNEPWSADLLNIATNRKVCPNSFSTQKPLQSTCYMAF